MGDAGEHNTTQCNADKDYVTMLQTSWLHSQAWPGYQPQPCNLMHHALGFTQRVQSGLAGRPAQPLVGQPAARLEGKEKSELAT
jgi:hypothetical protein